MPINENEDQVFSVSEIYELADSDNPTQIADNEAIRKEYSKRFDFDPEVSLWDEAELKKRKQADLVRDQARRNQQALKALQTESSKRVALDDLDNLGKISTGIGALNFSGLSSAQLEDKILSITPQLNPKNASLAKKYQEQKTRQPKVYGIDPTQQIVKDAQQGLNFQRPAQQPTGAIAAPIEEQQGNIYINAIKRGAANIYQTGALLYDFGYLGFERTMEAAGGDQIGTPINSGLEPTQNKLFTAMEKLKQEKYGASYRLNNLMQGADLAGREAESNDRSATLAAINYMMENGELGDALEILAETAPSLGIGFGAGAVARRTVGAAAERAVAKKAGSIASRAGEVVDPKRLAQFAAPAGGAIQGAVIAGATDFSGSAGAEYSAAYNEGKAMGESIDYAMRRSLSQAGVSGLGGALLPLQFGNRLATTVGQSAIQGVAGYASAVAGAAAVDEELSPSEAALNVIMGSLTALPEVIAVGSGETISKRQLIQDIESGLLEQTLINKAKQEDEQNVKAGYFAGVIGNLIDRVKESKTAGRSEDTLREFINQVREDTGATDAVYVDVETFNQTLNKHNIPLDDMFALSPELAGQWERVEDISGTIRIPLDELLSMAYKIDNDALLKDIVSSMRSNPLMPNAMEAAQSLARTADEMKQDVDSIIQNYNQIRDLQDDLATVEQLIKEDLNNLEFGFEKKTGYNEQAATLVGAMYETLASKMGIPARQLYDAMPLRVVSDAETAKVILGEIGMESFAQSLADISKDDFQTYLKDKYSIDVGLTANRDNSVLTVEKIVVPESNRNGGIGTQAMQEIIDYADLTGKKVALTPSADFGGNKKRLTDFYKRFGFVENKGRNKDYEISETMYRDSKEAFNQKARGEIQFRRDKKGSVIILGKDADFSTFAHEIGHHFLELNMMFARRPDAPEQLKNDMTTVMEWAGLDPDIATWNDLTPEQKTEVHEKFAETFEQYMFTGKSPSNKLRQVFARFRSFMTAVYKNLGRFLGVNARADLNPEITAVMDRLVATQDAIDQVQRQRHLEMLITPEMATQLGIPYKEYLEMVDLHNDATEAAINELEQKTIKDLAWYRNLRNKHIAAFNSQAKRIRQQIKEKAAAEVAQEPVYQAIAYLRQPVEKQETVRRDPNVVDTARDTLLDAVAKMGGIDAAEIESTWGIDQPESYKVHVGRIKKVARKGGLSIETVAERLAEYGYLQKDEYGKYDTRELEDLFTDSLSGGQYYSVFADYDLFHHADDFGLAMANLPEFPDAAKLNLEWIKAKYGEESIIYQSIPKNGKYALASLDGFDPEAIASRFGYESADQMIREIIDAPAPKEVINQRTNELIEAQHADLFDKNAVDQAIDEAVHNDIRSQMLAREMAAIGKLMGRHNELNEAAKNIANNIIDNTPVADIRPAVFSATELKLARQYDQALKKGDTTEAVRIKRNQLINFHATKRAYQIQDQIKSLTALGGKIFGNDQKLAKARDFNYVSFARYILGAFGVVNRQANYMKELEAIREYDPVAWGELKDLEAALPPLDNFKNMTYKDFQVIDDTVRQVWHLSKESRKFYLAGKKLDRDQVIAELSNQISGKAKRSRVYNGPGSGSKSIQRIGSQVIGFIASQRRAEQFLTWVDGGNRNGTFHKYIFNPIQEALAGYRKAQTEMKKDVLDIFSQFDMKEGKIYAEEIGYTFKGKDELIHAILHSGNLSNKQRLVYGRGWGAELDDGTVDFSKWDNYLQRAMTDGTITKNDMDAVQRIWNLFDGYKRKAQNVHKRMNGRYFEELPNQPLNTPFGVYDGGYVPADYDPIASAEADIRSEKTNLQKEQEQLGAATTGANFTKSRVDRFKGDILLLDLTRLPLHLDRELRYIHLEEQVRQVDSVLRNREFRKELESVAPYVKEILTKWLSAVATQQVYKPSGNNLGDRAVETLKRNTGITLMAGNIKNAVETWTSLPQVMVEVSPKHLSVTAGKYFANSVRSQSMTAEVRRLSPFMDSRLDTAGNDIQYQIERVVTNPGKFRTATEWVRNQAYFMQRVTQVPLEVISWSAAYDQSIAKGMTEAEAVNFADGIVREYLNDMTPEGVSSLERGSPLVRAMLMFYGWFNMVGNTFATQAKLINESDRSTLSKIGAHTYLYGMMIALPAMLSKALTLSFTGELFDNEDEEDWEADLINIVLKSQVEMGIGMLPFIRDPLNYAYKQTTSTTSYTDRYSVTPITSMAETLYKAGKTTAKIATAKLSDEESDIDKSKATRELLQASTFATGIPFTLVQRPAVYSIDVLVDEDQEPENSFDAARGLVSGR